MSEVRNVELLLVKDDVAFQGMRNGVRLWLNESQCTTLWLTDGELDTLRRLLAK